MKKYLSLLLMICLFCTALAVPAWADTKFEWYDLKMTLPEGEWYKADGEGGTVYFYRNEELYSDNGMLMFMTLDISDVTGTSDPVEDVNALYDSMVADLSQGSYDGNYESQYAELAGFPSCVYCDWENIEGLTAVAVHIALIRKTVFIFYYIHPFRTPENLAKEVVNMGKTAEYVESELPARDNPATMDPSITAGQDLVTAMWMMDDNSRAWCTMMMLLDLYTESFSTEDPFEYDLMNNPSYIGCAEDTIYLLIPDAYLYKAITLEYDTVEQTALYYYDDWSEDLVKSFEEELCIDQFYENSQESLLAAAQSIYNDNN